MSNTITPQQEQMVCNMAKKLMRLHPGWKPTSLQDLKEKAIQQYPVILSSDTNMQEFCKTYKREYDKQKLEQSIQSNLPPTTKSQRGLLLAEAAGLRAQADRLEILAQQLRG